MCSKMLLPWVMKAEKRTRLPPMWRGFKCRRRHMLVLSITPRGFSGFPRLFKKPTLLNWGGHWGIPNTAIPYEKLANTKIACRKWTKYPYRFYDRWRLLNVVSISRVFFMSSMCTPEINLSLREKTWEDLELIDTTIEKPGHWMSYQFHHRVTVRNCVFIYR